MTTHGDHEEDHGHSHTHEDGTVCTGDHSRRLPCIILTGYLGAGKTTLLNYILKEQRDKKIAVIENEVGEVSIDDVLVQEKVQDTATEVTVLDNGCVCCNIRGDLVKTLASIGEKHKGGLALDAVLIELTGAADPAPVVQTFFMMPEVRSSFYVDNVVALVDAKHAIEKLDESKGDPKEKGTAQAQIAFSSTVLLNKVDLADDARITEIEKRIKQINSTVNIIRCQEARVPMQQVFDVGAFNLDRVLEEQYMEEEEFNSFYKPKMDTTVSNVGIRCTGSISMPAFDQFLDAVLNPNTAEDFLRIKAVLDIKGREDKFVLQCVHMVKRGAFSEPWVDGQLRENRIIFIGRNMQERREMLNEHFMACLAKPLRFEVGQEVLAKTGTSGQGEEKRVSADDGLAYTFKTFIDYYGEEDGTKKWEASEKEKEWMPGVILAQWDCMYPYKIKITWEGDEEWIYRPVHDDDMHVRAAGEGA